MLEKERCIDGAGKILAEEREALKREREMRALDHATWKRDVEQHKHALDVEKAKRTKVESALNCVTCTQRARKVLVLPCKHLALCGVCSEGATTCPLCGANVGYKFDVFFI